MHKKISKWPDHKCFEKHLLKNAKNLMTSRYVVKWKWVKDPKSASWKRIIRMRLVLRGFMETGAFLLDIYSGTVKRTFQRILPSEAACHPNFILASLDIDTAFNLQKPRESRCVKVISIYQTLVYHFFVRLRDMKPLILEQRYCTVAMMHQDVSR